MRPKLSPGAEVALVAWNLMGGLEWSGFPLVCEMLGVEDPRALAQALATIRDELNRQQAERMKS